jgi:putative ABC transport system permease protein
VATDHVVSSRRTSRGVKHFSDTPISKAYVVSQRTREIGIRTALGAQLAELLGMFVRHGLLLAGVGAPVGLVAAAGLTRLMSSLLFGVPVLDPVTSAAVSALLILAAVLASYLPARRAIAVDPVLALRAE